MTACHSAVYDAIRDFMRKLAPGPTAAGRRVLVVDDDEATRRFVGRVLRDAGYEVAVAEDGLEAIAVAQHAEPIDVVVTDLLMPSMNGDELVRRLRKMQPALKVLYLTGFSDRLFEERTCLWEDEAYLDKPCRASALLEAVALLVCGRLAVDGQVATDTEQQLDPAA